MTRITPDHETIDLKPHVQRDPAADKRRDWLHYTRAMRGRRGAFGDLDTPRTPALRSDGAHQVARKQAVKQARQTAHVEERWWRKYFRVWREWMADRTDIDDVGR